MTFSEGQKKSVFQLTNEGKAPTRVRAVGCFGLCHFPHFQPRRPRTALQRATYQVVDAGVVTKTHLGLRRVDVDVELRGVQLKKEKDHPSLTRQRVPHRAVEGTVTHRPAVDEKVIASPPDLCSCQDEPPHPASHPSVVKLL